MSNINCYGGFLNLAYDLLFAGFTFDDKDDISKYASDLNDFEINVLVGVMKRIEEGRV